MRIWMMVVGAIGLLACGEKRRELPKAADDAGVDIKQSSSAAKPQEVVKVLQQLEWTVGLTRPLMLLEYTSASGHPVFCSKGPELLKHIASTIGDDATKPCRAQLVTSPDEVSVRCEIPVPGLCTHVYRATLWTELDRMNEAKYRLYATAWLNQVVCADNNNGQNTGVDPGVLFHVGLGNSFRSLLDQCRQ